MPVKLYGWLAFATFQRVPKWSRVVTLTLTAFTLSMDDVEPSLRQPEILQRTLFTLRGIDGFGSRRVDANQVLRAFNIAKLDGLS